MLVTKDLALLCQALAGVTIVTKDVVCLFDLPLSRSIYIMSDQSHTAFYSFGQIRKVEVWVVHAHSATCLPQGVAPSRAVA